MKKIVILERSHEFRELLKLQFNLLDFPVAVIDVHDSEQIVSYLASREYDYAIIELEDLNPLFREKPHLLKAISTATKIIFITTGLTALLKLTMVSRRMEIYDKFTEFESVLQCLNRHTLPVFADNSLTKPN